jgi:hypothetical protein
VHAQVIFVGNYNAIYARISLEEFAVRCTSIKVATVVAFPIPIKAASMPKNAKCASVFGRHCVQLVSCVVQRFAPERVRTGLLFKENAAVGHLHEPVGGNSPSIGLSGKYHIVRIEECLCDRGVRMHSCSFNDDLF